jgi:hypothetical protein
LTDETTSGGNIGAPIEGKSEGPGNPNAILHYGQPLDKRQQALLDALPEYDSKVTVPKGSANMSDLSALTAKTGVEYAMFTKGSERLIIRGDEKKVNIGLEEARALNAQGYRWSGHTHVGVAPNVLIASDNDVKILAQFDRQDMSVVYSSSGQFLPFTKA